MPVPPAASAAAAAAADSVALEDQLLWLHQHPEQSYADVLFLMPELSMTATTLSSSSSFSSSLSSSSSSSALLLLPPRLWAHSALLAVINQKPLARLGQALSSATVNVVHRGVTLPRLSACGLPYTIVVVAATTESDLAVRKLVAGCYRPVVLRSLWEKMGGKHEMLNALDEVFTAKQPDSYGSADYDSRDGDYGGNCSESIGDDGDDYNDNTGITTVSVSSLFSISNLNAVFGGDLILRIEGEPTAAFTIHKFLLDLRVPYFSTMFRSAFADATLVEHVLSSEYFTPLSLAIVVQYIYLDDADLLFSWKWTDFVRYLNSSKCSTDINPPTQDILDSFVDALVAAKFLQLESLERWVTDCLVKIAHGFSCIGLQCAKLLPGIASIGYQNSIMTLYKPCIAWLSRHQNISILWKRNLLSLPVEVRADMVRDVKAHVTGANVIPLYLRLYNLRQNTETSAFRQDWEASLLSPLFNYCVDFVAVHFADPRIVFSAARGIHNKPQSIPYMAIEDLFSLVISKLERTNATVIWRGTDCYLKLIGTNAIIDSLNQNIIAWFNKNWEQLVVAQSNSSALPSSSSTAGEFIGFNQWSDDNLYKLSSQIKIYIADLKGLNPAAKKMEYRREKWLEKCRIEEANRLSRRRDLLRLREIEEERKRQSTTVSRHQSRYVDLE
ncbi:hypothetical protein V1514DRAFT_340144 [Lipomyces japonicus]|uniref:uncharacterized protein n=1 Tax=Lipomyces japonicus TaxID=56871 RepID=UPI0034CE1EAA